MFVLAIWAKVGMAGDRELDIWSCIDGYQGRDQGLMSVVQCVYDDL